jgi:uncharacterized SAM-binding protein YcdF (DUF218 family)
MKPPQRRWSRLALWAVIAGVLFWIGTAVAVVVWGVRDGARPADAIVVLGAAQYAGRPSPVLRARLDHAIALYKRGLAPQLVLTGGTGVGDTTSEAAVGRRYVMRRDVPDSAILTENVGRTTVESIAAVAAMLQQRQKTRVILVSDPFHMLRLRVLAAQFGLTPYTSPTQTSPISANRGEALSYVVSESVKVPLTLIMGLTR